MLRSPSEYFLKYLLSHPLVTVQEALRAARKGEIEYIPGEEDYLAEVKDRMRFPLNYDPQNSSHRPSMDFLIRERIYDMWYPSRATNQAVELYKAPDMREVLCSLLSTPMPVSGIIKYMHSQFPADIEDQAVAEFRHYFWNVDLLSFQDRKILMASPSCSELIRTAISTYKDSLGPLLIMHKLGHSVPLRKEDVLTGIRNITYMDGVIVSRTFSEGKIKAGIMEKYFRIALEAQGKMEGIEKDEEAVISDFYKNMTVGKEEFDPPTRDVLRLKERNDESGKESGPEEVDPG